MEEIDATDKLATGIAFYEGNQSVEKDFQKAARYFNAALSARKREANYYLGLLYQTGQGVDRCNISAFEFFSSGMSAIDPKAMRELGKCYLFEVLNRYSLCLLESTLIRSTRKLYAMIPTEDAFSVVTR